MKEYQIVTSVQSKSLTFKERIEILIMKGGETLILIVPHTCVQHILIFIIAILM